MNRRRGEADPIPDFSAMDHLTPGQSCVKGFSDSNFFMNEWLLAEKLKMEEEKEKRRQKKIKVKLYLELY